MKQTFYFNQPALEEGQELITKKKKELAAVLIYSLASRRTQEDEGSVLSVETMAVCSEPARN